MTWNSPHGVVGIVASTGAIAGCFEETYDGVTVRDFISTSSILRCYHVIDM